MKKILHITVIVGAALMMMSVTAQAQGVLNRIGNAAQRAAENAVTRQAERRTEQAVDRTIDGVFESLENNQQQQAPAETPANSGAGNSAAPTPAAPAATPTPATSTSTVPVASSQMQNTFFPTKAGVTMVYVQKDDRGRVSGHTRQTIRSVEGSGNNMSISYLSEVLDENLKPTDPPVSIPCEVVIKDGVMYLYMNQFLAGQMPSEQLSVEITGVPMELPGNMQPGQSLKDANITISIDMGIMNMNTVIKMTNGKCEAIENVTVPAGTFTCYKVSQTVTTTVMRRDVSATTVTWYAAGIGTVKTESYDNRNNLTSSMELLSIDN